MSERNNINILTAYSEEGGIDSKALEELGYRLLPPVHDGREALRVILEKRPEVVMCEVFLPGLDALGLLEMLEEKAYRGVVICISSCPNDILAERLMQNGAAHFLVKPLGYEFLARRIDQAVREKNEARLSSFSPTPQINDKFDLENCISELMRQIGVPAHIRGYKYIRQAILLSLEDAEMLNAITKQLYPTVARTYKTTPSRVERAIRHAIEVAWTRGDIEVLTSMFGYTVKTSKGKPTNGEFISMLTDRLRLSLKIS